jgi:SAM-dependent methyltransferase
MTDFWQARLDTKSLDLDVVGHRALGQGYNEIIYQRRAEALRDAIVATGLSPERINVLDMGCGSGFYVSFWNGMGVKHLAGIDISPNSISRLSTQFPDYRFAQFNLKHASPTSEWLSAFDCATLFDVLYHLTDDQEAANALKFAADCLMPGGRLFIFDQLSNKDYSLLTHVKFRGRSTFSKLVKDAGFVIETRIPLFGLLAPPVFGNKFADLLISALYRIIGVFTKPFPTFGRVIGRGFYRVDRLLFKYNIAIPNHELFILRKKQS